jgi:hypothetical protein
MPRPFDLFPNAAGRACPAPTPRPRRGEARLALAPRAAPWQGKKARGHGTRSLPAMASRRSSGLNRRSSSGPLRSGTSHPAVPGRPFEIVTGPCAVPAAIHAPVRLKAKFEILLSIGRLRGATQNIQTQAEITAKESAITTGFFNGQVPRPRGAGRGMPRPYKGGAGHARPTRGAGGNRIMRSSPAVRPTPGCRRQCHRRAV